MSIALISKQDKYTVEKENIRLMPLMTTDANILPNNYYYQIEFQIILKKWFPMIKWCLLPGQKKIQYSKLINLIQHINTKARIKTIWSSHKMHKNIWQNSTFVQDKNSQNSGYRET